MAKQASKAQQTPTPTITVNGQPASTTASLTGNTGLPTATMASGAMATMAATLTSMAQGNGNEVSPAARLQAMQAAGTAAQGATALAHKAGNTALGKLPAGSYTVNPAKAGTVSKAGFNATAWAAIVATGGGLPSTLASAIQAATGCAGTVASQHVAYRVKQGWLQPVAA